MKRLLLLLSITGALASAQSPAGDAKHGKELFLSYACYSCHSFDGHGGAGARLVPMPLNQTAFIAFVRNAGRMPSYSSKALPDTKLIDIYAYIKTLPASPDAKSIPLIQELLKEN
jgi:mono/diheme cytochrome c family protein